jgi:hypothetical protein
VGRTLLRLAPESVVNLEDLAVRRELEEQYAPLLAARMGCVTSTSPGCDHISGS